jgi:hypothetical protein
MNATARVEAARRVPAHRSTSRSEAIAIATGIIGTGTMATVEVRPILEQEGVPAVPQGDRLK